MLSKIDIERILGEIGNIRATGEMDVNMHQFSMEVINEYPSEPVFHLLYGYYMGIVNKSKYSDADWSILPSRIYDAITKLNKFDVVSFLLEFKLKSNSSSDRWSACRRLQEFNDPRILDALCKTSLEDPDPDVRLAAIESLEKIGDLAAIGTLEYVRDRDIDSDSDGFSIANAASDAIAAILARNSK